MSLHVMLVHTNLVFISQLVIAFFLNVLLDEAISFSQFTSQFDDSRISTT